MANDCVSGAKLKLFSPESEISLSMKQRKTFFRVEIVTNTVAFATKFFPLLLKYLEKSQICDLLSPLLFRNKRVSSCHFAATFAKINKYCT